MVKLDDLISRTVRDLAGAREPMKRALLVSHLSALQNSLAIRVSTKSESKLMLDVYKNSLATFPYPFGEHYCWVEIPDLTGTVCYHLMPPDDTWPHWQILLNPDPPYSDATFIWTSDGRIGPHKDRKGGQSCGPTLFIFQDTGRCHHCQYLDAEKSDLVWGFSLVDTSIPAWERALSRRKACRFVYGPDTQRCTQSADAWDAALLPLSIILYIALAPTRELDISWRAPRVLGHGKTLRCKVGFYQVTPIKKAYFHRRLASYLTGGKQHIEKRFFVRGHVRHSHVRRSCGGGLTKVKEHWVKAYWKGPDDTGMAPHRYAVDWPVDERVDAAHRLVRDVPRNYSREVSAPTLRGTSG